MPRITGVVMAAFAALALVQAEAGAGDRLEASTGGPGADPPKVGCAVAGTPVAFPDDIWIMNKGHVALAAGTAIEWVIADLGKSGRFVLPAELPPGHGIDVAGVLGDGADAGHRCKAAIGAAAPA
ncbi:MAG TPA: hypothetical protein PKA74_02490 [Bauldia sp.]|nr:hypothetical protein [Bauldia sp.]